jgi:ATP-binding cassette subfamily B protein
MTGSLWHRIWRELAGHRISVATLFVLEVLAVPLALLAPIPLAIAVDSAIDGQPVPGWLGWLPSAATDSPTAIAVTAALLTVLIAALDHLRGVSSWLIGAATGQRILLRFRTRMFAHAQRMSVAYHDRNSTADSTYRIQYDAPAVQHLATDALAPLVSASLTLVGMVVVLAALDVWLAVTVMSVVPALFFISRWYRHRLRAQWTEVRGADTAAMGAMHQTFGALRLVKVFGREDHEARRFATLGRATLRGELRAAFLEAGLWMSVGMVLAVGSALVLFLGVQRTIDGQLSTGDLLVAVAYVASITGPLETLARQSGDVQASLASADRAFQLLAEPHEVPEAAHPVLLARAEGRVEFRDVTFRYGQSSGGIQHSNFVVLPGARVGIAGMTGAGKTTIVNLLSRFYDVESGAVLLDGRDIRDYALADLRRQFAVVQQEPILFSTSIAENIGYARASSRPASIVEAARAAHAHEFIERLPDGYDTVVGERGMTLSGGQRQRIAIARAFLKDAPVLVLDEPTSAVDSVTEGKIVEAMSTLMAGRTTFVVSHRPALLELCDSVLVVHDGRVSLESRPQPPTARYVGAAR